MALLLIADDLSISRETLARVLREPGHRVISASSGEDAIERARQEPPDMALLDFNMQGMNGAQTAAALKAQCGAPFLPVMIISGKVIGPTELTQLLQVTDDFVRKPYTPAEVCARVEVWLRVRRLMEEQRRGASASSGSSLHGPPRRSGLHEVVPLSASSQSATMSQSGSAGRHKGEGSPPLGPLVSGGLRPPLGATPGLSQSSSGTGPILLEEGRGFRGRADLLRRLEELWQRGQRGSEPFALLLFELLSEAAPPSATSGVHTPEALEGRGRPDGAYAAPEGRGGAYAAPEGRGGAYAAPEGRGGAYAAPEGRGRPDGVASLAAAVRALARLVRLGDQVGPVGTAQFGVILPGVMLSGALAAAERLRHELRALHQRRQLAGPVVLGGALFPARDAADAKDLLHAAERALARAQQEGPFSLCIHQHQGYLVRAS